MADAVRLCCAECGQMNRVPLARLASGPKCGVCGAALLDGRVMELDAAVHDKMIGGAARGDDLPLIVDYWAAWCGPCRMMAPEFAKAAREMAPGIRFAKLDTEAHQAVAQRAGIRGIPALILYHRGREVARLSGARPAADIVAFVRSHVGAQTGPGLG